MLTYADVCRYERGNQKMESLNGERTLLQVFFLCVFFPRKMESLFFFLKMESLNGERTLLQVCVCVWRGSMLSIKGLLRHC
jgi:hypothetical protein